MEQTNRTVIHPTYLMAASGPRADDFVKCTNPTCPTIETHGRRPHCHPIFAWTKRMEGLMLRTWISEKVFSAASRIHGMGVFAKSAIPAGEVIFIWGGAVISPEEAASGDYQGQSIWPLTEHSYLAYPKSDNNQHRDEDINHSCDANAWLINARTVVARRDIAAGEEITLDQGTWNTDDLYTDAGERCSCGAPDCRGALTGRDWKIPAVQTRYAGHFHPAIST